MPTFRKTSFCLNAKLLQATAVFLICATLLACFGATPLPKRTRTPTGTELKKLDLSFIRPGETTRAEVQDRLRAIDTGYEGDRFFLGRWSSSTWGGWIILPGGPCCGAEGAAGRVWKTGNLLIEFDDQGIVKRIESFQDHKAVQVLAPVADNTPVPLDPPLEMSVNYWKDTTVYVPARIVLSKDRFDFEELSEQKKRHVFSVPSRDLRKIGSPLGMAGTDPIVAGRRVECIRDLKKLGGPRGKHINLQLTMPQLITLMRYVSDANATANRENRAAER